MEGLATSDTIQPPDSAQRQAPAGRIVVLPQAIATIAARAALATDGVVALASPMPRDEVALALPPADAHRGVDVSLRGDQVTVEIALIVAYSAPIAAVAEAARASVRGALERALGQRPAGVVVRVQGLSTWG
jgi:uncharacterized alkaline shock family protein YloU